MAAGEIMEIPPAGRRASKEVECFTDEDFLVVFPVAVVPVALPVVFPVVAALFVDAAVVFVSSAESVALLLGDDVGVALEAVIHIRILLT